MAGSRDQYLAQPDAKLVAECAVETYRASGPGGQHRNKTDSAVRLTHRPTGVSVTATERRSQHENRRVAMKRLRKAIALRVREAADAGAPPKGSLAEALADPRWSRISQKSNAYLIAAAHILDHLEAVGVFQESVDVDRAAVAGAHLGHAVALHEAPPRICDLLADIRLQAWGRGL